MTPNPFELVTASKLSAEDAVSLWCDDYRLPRVSSKESCFINGNRGTGKSMLFRILQYDCQKLLKPETSDEPDFLSVYFSVRDSELVVEEFSLFQEDSQRNILSESHLALLILKQLFLLLQKHPELIGEDVQIEFIDIIQKNIRNAFQFCTPDAPSLTTNFDSLLPEVLECLEVERTRIVHYVGLRFYEHTRFDGPLFLFDTLLSPLANFLRERLNKTLYVLVDDGDDLPESHTIVLNTWIARRNPSVVFKVSTMFGYKTYQTRGRSAIQHPHDFTQYDINTRYLSDKNEDYIDLIRKITIKRLEKSGIFVEPEVFFPEDEKQKQKLKDLEGILTSEYSKKYQARSVNDYVYRHLTSEYIKRVLLKGRSTHTYSYSGFKVLATLSSGMVRDFIICAQKMFDQASKQMLDQKRTNKDVVKRIPPSIQTAVVKTHADNLLAEVSEATQKRFSTSSTQDWLRVSRCIAGLANLFKAKMLSDDSERRVFSFAFQDEPPERVERLLELAISEGYLMKGFISRKEGTGRRTLYVLTRRLAPAFNLDVTAYAGYMSVTSTRIWNLMEHGPEQILFASPDQLTFFDTEFFNDAPAEEQVEQQKIWMFISPEEAGQ